MPLFQTDQFDCFNTSGKPLPCKGTGQDGDSRAGRVWPDPRFISSDKTVTDQITGLVWLKDAGLSEFPLSWSETFDFVRELNAENHCGLNQWRLPSRHEMFSLISHTRINPAVVRPNLFMNLFNGYYWTHTSCARYPDQAWYLHLGGGRVVKGMKHASYMTWPVCGMIGNKQISESEALPGDEKERFIQLNGMVADRKTRLNWMQQANPSDVAVTWKDALSLIQQTNQKKYLGFSDWRLPNIRELESLVDDRRHSPAIQSHELFADIRPFYWSATTSLFEPSYAWTLYTDDGNIGVGYKADPEFHVWPVRSAG